MDLPERVTVETFDGRIESKEVTGIFKTGVEIRWNRLSGSVVFSLEHGLNKNKYMRLDAASLQICRAYAESKKIRYRNRGHGSLHNHAATKYQTKKRNDDKQGSLW